MTNMFLMFIRQRIFYSNNFIKNVKYNIFLRSPKKLDFIFKHTLLLFFLTSEKKLDFIFTHILFRINTLIFFVVIHTDRCLKRKSDIYYLFYCLYDAVTIQVLLGHI